MEKPSPKPFERLYTHPASKICVLVSLFLAACMLMLLLFFQYGKDQGVFAVVGRIILEGGAPYKDAWDIKPPGIFFIYAFARVLFGAGQQAVRILEVLNFLALTWAFAIYSRRHFNSVWTGICAGCLAVINHVQMGFWDTAQPESFGATVLAWALVFATYQSSNKKYHLKQTLSWALSGFLFGAAALLKPPLGGSILVSITVVATMQIRYSAGIDKLKKAFSVITFFCSGMLFFLILAFLYFAQKDALHDMYNTFFVYIPGHVGLTFTFQNTPILLYRTIRYWLLSFSIFTSIGMIFCFLLPRCHIREREGCVHILGVVLFQIIGITMQAKYFPYHFGVIMPMTALLAAWGYAKLWKKTNQKWILLVGFLITLLWQLHEKDIFRHSVLQIQALANRDLKDTMNDSLYSIHDQNTCANRKAAEWLSQNTPVDSPVFIWGFEPVIYCLSNRSSSSRYIYNLPQRAGWEKKESRELLIKELYAVPPSAIIIIHNDPLPHVTGNQLDSAEELKTFSELLDLLATNYIYVQSFEDLDIYKNKKFIITDVQDE